MNIKYIPPKKLLRSFTCPHCGAITEQVWYKDFIGYKCHEPGKSKIDKLNLTQCNVCEKLTLWINNEMVYPLF